MDPLTRDFPELTPYQFASNTPILAVDLDGLEAKLYLFHRYKDGSTQLTIHKDVDKYVFSDPRENLHQAFEKMFNLNFPDKGKVILNVYHDEQNNMQGRFVSWEPKYENPKEKGIEINDGGTNASKIPLVPKLIVGMNPITATYDAISILLYDQDIYGDKPDKIDKGLAVAGIFLEGLGGAKKILKPILKTDKVIKTEKTVVKTEKASKAEGAVQNAVDAASITKTTVDHFKDKQEAKKGE